MKKGNKNNGGNSAAAKATPAKKSPAVPVAPSAPALDMGLVSKAAAKDLEQLSGITESDLLAAATAANTTIPPGTAPSVLETINRLSEEYLCGLLEDELVMDERIREAIPPRLAELQRQLEKLETEKFLAERSQVLAAGGPDAAKFEANDALLASINAKFNQSRNSYSALQSRLAEMQEQLSLGKLKAAAKAAAAEKLRLREGADKSEIMGKKTKILPERVRTGEFPTVEGEAFDNEDDDEDAGALEGRADYDDYLEDDEWPSEEDEEAEGHIPDIRKTRDGRILGPKGDADAKTEEGTPEEEFDVVVTRSEAELDNAFAILASPHLSLEEKLGLVKKKFFQVIQQDLYWRSEASKAVKRVQELKLEKRIAGMERDRLAAINGRLETFCRDLQAENRRVRTETQRVEEAVKAALGSLATPPILTSPDLAGSVSSSSGATGTGGAAPSASAAASNANKKKKGGATSAAAAAATENITRPALNAFALPSLPNRDELLKAEKDALVDRVMGLADLFLGRETHYESVLHGLDAESRLHQTQLARQHHFLRATCTKLEQTERRLAHLARSEAELKAQVRQYVDKFRQVEETLVKSNELFGTFRGEMEAMSAKLGRFERENGQMHAKCATLSRNIIEMADERARLTTALETAKAQKAKLEALCRTLQAERNQSSGNAAPAAPGATAAASAATDEQKPQPQQQQPAQQ